jgi:hypothetical protein
MGNSELKTTTKPHEQIHREGAEGEKGGFGFFFTSA